MWVSFHFQSGLFSLWILTCQKQRSYCFRKFLIIYNIFLVQILVISFFNFFQERHTFIPLFYIKVAVSSVFFRKKLFLSLDLFIICLESSFVIKGLIGSNKLICKRSKTMYECLFNVWMLILQDLLNSLSLVTYIWLSVKEFLNSSLGKCLNDI